MVENLGLLLDQALEQSLGMPVKALRTAIVMGLQLDSGHGHQGGSLMFVLARTPKHIHRLVHNPAKVRGGVLFKDRNVQHGDALHVGWDRFPF